jgi:hypothetical protein
MHFGRQTVKWPLPIQPMMVQSGQTPPSAINFRDGKQLMSLSHFDFLVSRYRSVFNSKSCRLYSGSMRGKGQAAESTFSSIASTCSGCVTRRRNRSSHPLLSTGSIPSQNRSLEGRMELARLNAKVKVPRKADKVPLWSRILMKLSTIRT